MSEKTDQSYQTTRSDILISIIADRGAVGSVDALPLQGSKIDFVEDYLT
jgi:hypothetical protein